jgi:dolichol-phosphate mannosyltransferase
MIYFIIPTYNEALNIPNLRISLKDYAGREDAFFVFSDDCSSDGTIEIISEHFESENLKILKSKTNQGPGNAFNKGFDWVLDNYSNKDDVVITMEADCTSDIGILETMILLNKQGYHLVLASIYAQGGNFYKTSIFRRLISFTANLILRLVFDIKVLTLSSFYRVYAIEKLLALKNKHNEIITQKGFLCMLEVLIRFIRINAKVIEVPMIMKSDKRKGKSKMKILKTSLEYMWYILKSIR